MKLKMKIARNLAVAQFKLHDYESALGWFNTVMEDEPSTRDGFSIILCHCCLRHEPQHLKDAFSNLVHVELEVRLVLMLLILSLTTRPFIIQQARYRYVPLGLIFTARRNARIASAVLAIAIPSVRLSHAGIVSKRRHVARCSFHRWIAKCV